MVNVGRGATSRSGEHHPAYYCWQTMIQRCTNPRNTAWASYGGRGITVCDRWRHDFWAFVADLGPRPEGLTLDRIDNDGPYEPGNVRWATRKQQSGNRRHSPVPHLTGEDHPMRRLTWAKVADIRARHAAGETQASLGRAFAVTQANISRIVKGQTWVA